MNVQSIDFFPTIMYIMIWNITNNKLNLILFTAVRLPLLLVIFQIDFDFCCCLIFITFIMKNSNNGEYIRVKSLKSGINFFIVSVVLLGWL